MKLAALTAAVIAFFTSCKNDCDRAAEHIVDLATAEAQKVAKDARPDFDTSYLAENAELRALALKQSQRRLASRCSDPALLACVVAAKSSIDVGACGLPPAGF